MSSLKSIATQLGARGGAKTFEKYGKEHFAKIQAKAVKARKRNAKMAKLVENKAE